MAEVNNNNNANFEIWYFGYGLFLIVIIGIVQNSSMRDGDFFPDLFILLIAGF